MHRALTVSTGHTAGKDSPALGSARLTGGRSESSKLVWSGTVDDRGQPDGAQVLAIEVHVLSWRSMICRVGRGSPWARWSC